MLLIVVGRLIYYRLTGEALQPRMEASRMRLVWACQFTLHLMVPRVNSESLFATYWHGLAIVLNEELPDSNLSFSAVIEDM